MNITSYNVTDVAYHYIGLRVIKSVSSDSTKETQFNTISRNVLKYASDKALRLMLPAPKGDFQSAGEKVCQELSHLGLVEASHGKGYSLTSAGIEVLELLNSGKYVDLRRQMIKLHIQTYDNLREVVWKQLNGKGIWSPIVDAKRYMQVDYIEKLLAPTFEKDAFSTASKILASNFELTANKLEDILRDFVLKREFSQLKLSVALFRSMSDRLSSLRLINIMRASKNECDFAKSYSPCCIDSTKKPWHSPLSLDLENEKDIVIYLSEPDMKDKSLIQTLIAVIDESLPQMTPLAGYFDLPQLRDIICEKMMIHELSFDEGVNMLLDLQPSPLTVGLSYEGISGRRKPLVRDRGSIQIFNLVRRT